MPTNKKESLSDKEVLGLLGKQARKALREAGLWQQEFNGNEIVGVIAIFQAQRTELEKHKKALCLAISHIGAGNCPTDILALEDINQIIAGESINQSIDKQSKIKKH